MTVRRTQRGFGLIELLVTLAVLTMIFSIGVPSYENFSKKNRAVAYVEEMNAALRLARQVAIEHNFRTRVCAKASNAFDQGEVDETDCGSNWSNGFIVLVNKEGGGWQSIQNKALNAPTLTISVYKGDTPSNTLPYIELLPTGNLNYQVTSPNVTITVRNGSEVGKCTAVTKITISGRLSGEPISDC